MGEIKCIQAVVGITGTFLVDGFLKVYHFYVLRGENETMIGKALTDISRESVQIVTKGGMSPKMTPDGRPAVIRKAIEQSLKRLGTDYIDLFNLARIDTKIPIEETVEELKKLVTEGKWFSIIRKTVLSPLIKNYGRIFV